MEVTKKWAENASHESRFLFLKSSCHHKNIASIVLVFPILTWEPRDTKKARECVLSGNDRLPHVTMVWRMKDKESDNILLSM